MQVIVGYTDFVKGKRLNFERERVEKKSGEDNLDEINKVSVATPILFSFFPLTICSFMVIIDLLC